MLSTSPVTWDGGGDALSWTDPLNWDSDAVPSAGSDVVLPVRPQPYVVELDTAATVNSVRLTKELTIKFFLGGTTAGSAADQYTQLTTIDGITLGDSTLEVALSNGFVPSLGDTFTLVTHGSRSGVFAAESLPSLTAGLSWHVNYGGYNPYSSASIVLLVISTPTVTWDGDGDGVSWSDADNWSGDTLPGPTDNVLLPDFGEIYFVDFRDTSTINSLTLKSSAYLRIFSGSFTCTGDVNITAGGYLTQIAGDLQADGRFTLLGYGYLTIGGTFTQTATMHLATNCNPSIYPNGLLQVDGTLTVDTESLTLQGGTLQIDNLVDGTGRIVWQEGTVSGTGILDLKDSGHLLVVASSTATLSGSLTNKGSIQCGRFGDDLYWDDATLTNLGEFVFLSGSQKNMTAAGGTNLFINSGAVTGSSASLNFGIPFVNRGGVLNVQQFRTIGFTSTLTNEVGAILSGLGTIDVSNADFTNQGITNSVGILAITGDFPMSGTSVLNTEISGTSPGNGTRDHGQLNISGVATLDGTLNVTIWNGFTPALGDSFKIVTYASHMGSFDTANTPVLGGGLNWQVNATATGVTLVIIADADYDGLSDSDEVEIYHTFPDDPDSDDDGMNDGDEVAFWGDDWNADPDGDLLVNLLDPDSDNDGVIDGLETTDDPLIGGTPVEGLEGWFLSEWFGFYNTDFAPWLFHAQHGFIYRFPESTNASSYFYDNAMITWWWTNDSDYPTLYAFDPPEDLGGIDIASAWLWYFEGSRGPRSFAILSGPYAGSFMYFGP